jgi:hypothetical protein
MPLGTFALCVPLVRESLLAGMMGRWGVIRNTWRYSPKCVEGKFLELRQETV